MFKNILPRSSNWSSIAEHHSESFLVDRMLASRCSDFFFAWISSQCIFEFLVWNEARSNKEKHRRIKDNFLLRKIIDIYLIV